MPTVKIVSVTALMVLLAVGSSAAQPAAGGPKSAADAAAKPAAKAGAKAAQAPGQKLTKQEAKAAARKAKQDAKKAEKQAAKQAAKQARLAERKGQQGGKAAASQGQPATKMPGLAEKTGRGAPPPAPSNDSNAGGAQRGLDRAAGRANQQGIEKGRAHGRPGSPTATVKAKHPKNKVTN